MDISLTELEQAINDWRVRKPSTGEEHALSLEVNALASVYALMIYGHKNIVPLDKLDPFARQLLEDWLSQRAAGTTLVAR